MADMLSFMVNNPAALCSGFSTMFRDEMSRANRSEWSSAPEHVRKQIPWYRRKEAKPRSGEYRWREETERWIANEIARQTPGGLYLDARRRQVLDVLGMSLEEALAKLSFGPKGEDA